MENNIAKDSVTQKLKEGFQRFQETWFVSKNGDFEALKEGQNPRALIIACSDSRVDPAILMDSKPGDLFVIRNVANLVPPCEANDNSYHGVSAAMEYAVLHLKVDAIIILGHAGCGGIKSLLQRSADHKKEGFIDHWMDIAKSAKLRVDKNLAKAPEYIKQKAAEQWSIQDSLGNLMTFPWTRDAVTAGRLKLYGWYFDITTGELSQYDPEKNTFVSLVSPCSLKP